ncbi:hypothetical protein D9M68_660090 [compost metagenome]
MFLRLPGGADPGGRAGGDALYRRGICRRHFLRAGRHPGVLVPGRHARGHVDAGGAVHHDDRRLPGHGLDDRVEASPRSGAAARLRHAAGAARCARAGTGARARRAGRARVLQAAGHPAAGAHRAPAGILPAGARYAGRAAAGPACAQCAATRNQGAGTRAPGIPARSQRRAAAVEPAA